MFCELFIYGETNFTTQFYVIFALEQAISFYTLFDSLMLVRNSKNNVFNIIPIQINK